MKSELILEFQFTAAHFYKNENWDDKKNREVFGKCYDPYGHGHNYQLFIKIHKSSETSIVQIRDHIESKLSVLDHHHLNHQINYFKENIPTTENMTLFLSTHLLATHLYEIIEIRLMEEPTIGAVWIRPATSSSAKI